MQNHRLSTLIVLAVLILSACQSQTVPTAAPTTESIPVPPTATAQSIPEFPHGNADLAGPEQPAGLYKTPGFFKIPFTFETTEPFNGIGESFGQGHIFGISQGGASYPPYQILFWVTVPLFTADAAISQLQKTPEMTFSENQNVSVAGVSGIQFDSITETKTSIPALGTFVGVDSSWDTNVPQAHLRFIVLTVAERTLVIYIEAPKDEFDTFMSKVDQVLSTVEFE
jgi:hypothetical protein